MNTQKILTIIALAIGIIALFFLINIINIGDSAIVAGEGEGTVNIFIYIAYIVFALALFFTLLFTFINLFTHPKTLKSTLIGVGAFALLALICYFGFASGTETLLAEGDVLTAGESKLIGAGLYMFYFLAIIAVGAMIFTGFKKMIK